MTIHFRRYDPETLVEQNNNRIHNPYMTDVPSINRELKAKFTMNAERPVFRPVWRWPRSVLLTTKYPAATPPTASAAVKRISKLGAGSP